MFPRSAFSLTPDPGRTEPALWVRRLVVWREPGDIIRDISLAPGLNIIWSPDSETIGHGAGKSSFCRLLRYCLGEETYASDGQRQRISERLPNGHVGAEILLRERHWIVVRALSDRRHDVVIEGGKLDDAFGRDVSPTGMRLLREAITRSVIGEAASLMPVGESGAWGAALAWATRDQECRFGHHLEWRDPESGSRSPVGRSRDDRLAIVRALVGALSTDELTTSRMEQAEDTKQRELRTELERLDWQTKRARSALALALGENVGPAVGSALDPAGFKSAAAERLARALQLPDEVKVPDIERSRRERDEAKKELDRRDAELKEIDVRVEEKGKILGFLRAQLPEAHALLDKENVPVCPICKVRIDIAKAEGCGISLISCDLKMLQANIRQIEQDIRDQGAEIKALENKRPGLRADISIARQRSERLEAAVAALEKAQSARSKTIRDAQRLVYDAERYESLITEHGGATKDLDEVANRLSRVRETLGAHRAAVAETIRVLSERFDYILRELVPGEIEGEAKLDGNGLTLKTVMGGERSTPAIDSLKVIAFDLAVLAMTIEGRTHLPGLVVHDSPREADLGQPIYHRLFEFAAMLEGLSPAPLFQYIVTTTTAPPERFKTDPRLRLVIRGAPAEERLLKLDL